MNLAEIDLGQLINDAIKTIRERRHLDEAVIRFSAPAEKISVMGDRDEIQTVMGNLLDNAVKYSGEDPRVSVRLKSPSTRTAEIYVRDNGVGIPRGDLKRVFKRFYRVPTDAANAAKGTGLGLAIVRAIVERHGGRVKAESKGLGKGTTFVVQLPRV